MEPQRVSQMVAAMYGPRSQGSNAFDPRYGAMQPHPDSDFPMGGSALMPNPYGTQAMPMFGDDAFTGPSQNMGSGRPLSPQELSLQRRNDNIWQINQNSIKQGKAGNRPYLGWPQ